MAFAYVTPYTVQSGQVPSPQSGFPCVIADTQTRYAVVGSGGHVQSAAGYDLRPFVTVGGTPYVFQLEPTYNSATGAIALWVHVPTLTAGAVIQLCYGDPTLTTDGSSTATWDAAAIAVWHVVDAGATVADATVNALDMVTVNAGPATVGQIAVGINLAPSFDSGVVAYLRATNRAHFNVTSDAFMVSCWFKPTTLNNPLGTQVFVFKGGNAEDGYYGEIRNNGQIGFSTNQPGASQSTSSDVGVVPLGVFTYIAITRVGSAVRIYVNGVDRTGAPGTHLNPASVASYFFSWGTYANSSNTLAAPGVYDEMRVNAPERSADWILTEYNNQVAPLTFFTRGAETVPGGGPPPVVSAFLSF